MPTAQDVLIYAIEAQDHFSGVAAKVTAATQKMQAATGQAHAGFAGFGNAAGFAISELDSGTPILGEVVSILKSVGIAAAGAAVAFAGFSIYAMHAAADLESLRLGLAAYSGSVAETDKNMRRLREVARLPGLGIAEAIGGSTSLQAVGFDARLAERALMGFGNALALVGRGKDDLQGVIMALSQIVSKGTVSAEEINQIAERMPQIRQMMKSAFGTADTEKISKMTTPQGFIMKMIDAAELLPKATGGAKNAFENFGDTVMRVVTAVGDKLNSALLPAVNKVADFVDFLSDSNWFGNTTDRFFAAIAQAGRDAQDLAKRMAGTAVSMAKTADASKGLGVINGPASQLAMGASMAIDFLSAGKDLADTMVRGFSFVAATIEKMPQILSWTLAVLRENANGVVSMINGVVQTINGIISALNEGIDVKDPFGKVTLLHIGPKKAMPLMPLLNEPQSGFGLSPEQQAIGGGILEDITKRAQGLYQGFGAYKPSNEVAGDTSKGGFKDMESAIATNTAKTAENTSKMLDIQRSILGGGTVGAGAVSPVNISKALGVSGRGGKIDQAVKLIAEAVNEAIGQQWATAGRQSPGFGGRR